MKKLCVDLLLLLAAVLLAYGVLEAAFRIAMPHLPRAVFNNQGRELRVLGQTSKAGLLPREGYIAILGDSYGVGQGDWFAANGYDLNSRYQAAHLLRDATGRDVLALARAGAGSYDGAAIFAVNAFRFLRASGFDLPAPKTLVAYFYEGNDIGDNLEFLRRRFNPLHKPEDVWNDAVFDEFDREMDAAHCQGGLTRLQDAFYAANAVSRTIEGLLYNVRGKSPVPPGNLRSALIAGRETPLPDTMETDLTTLSEDDVRLGVRVFQRSLRRVVRVWPDAERFVVYIPSPLSLYVLSGDAGRTQREASLRIETLVREAALAEGWRVIDCRSDLEAAAREEFAHGPLDVNHLNREGYGALAGALARALSAPPAP